MIIEVHSPMWNEEFRLPWYLDHYEKIADRIFLYDNFSDDKSCEIATKHPKVVLRYYGSRELNNENLRLMKNNCWKRSTADWVIVCDIDEFVYHPNLRGLLAETKATIFQPAEAWDIISRKVPEDYKTLNRVAPAPFYRKNFVFRPRKIKEMNFGHGAHAAIPEGEVVIEIPEAMLMLHYQFIGEERLVERYRTNRDRRSALDRRQGWGIHYDIEKEKVLEIFNRGTVDVWSETQAGRAYVKQAV